MLANFPAGCYVFIPDFLRFFAEQGFYSFHAFIPVALNNTRHSIQRPEKIYRSRPGGS
jgi:hypothetical protein